jgi:lycopene cyclase domain-containing protein
MTYFGFLLQFVGLPIIVLLALAWIDKRRGKNLPQALRGWPAWAALAAHCLIALIYTTPWDNYLVATRVWWYDPALVTGITIGWVPIEEYTFFVVQPIMTGLFLLTLMRYLPISQEALKQRVRWLTLVPVAVLWLFSAALLLSGWRPGTYLGLELIWALPPIMLQLAFGADILWRHRRIVLPVILITTLYLSYADSLAISSGTWTIDPEQSLQIYLGGVLPIEEFVFFLLTNVLVTFGVTLVVAQESHERAQSLAHWLRTRRKTSRGQNVDLAV